jgi:hypothetical protein
VVSLLLLFPITDKCEEFQKEKQLQIDAGDKEVRLTTMYLPGNPC